MSPDTWTSLPAHPLWATLRGGGAEEDVFLQPAQELRVGGRAGLSPSSREPGHRSWFQPLPPTSPGTIVTRGLQRGLAPKGFLPHLASFINQCRLCCASPPLSPARHRYDTAAAVIETREAKRDVSRPAKGGARLTAATTLPSPAAASPGRRSGGRRSTPAAGARRPEPAGSAPLPCAALRRAVPDLARRRQAPRRRAGPYHRCHPGGGRMYHVGAAAGRRGGQRSAVVRSQLAASRGFAILQA